MLLGFLSICGLIGFIVGWVKSGELDHQGVMLAWTVAIAGNIGLQVMAGMATSG